MQHALQLERADLENDQFGFMDFLAEKAEVFETVQTLRSYLDFRKEVTINRKFIKESYAKV